MKRRTFLALSALNTVPAVARAEEPEHDATWEQTINRDALKFEAVADGGDITLQVELIRPPIEEVTAVKSENGEIICFQYKGKDQPYPFRPGCTVLTRFDLTWDGKAIRIPQRFWNDLPDLRIHTSTLDPEAIAPELQGVARAAWSGVAAHSWCQNAGKHRSESALPR